jgi:hypothetical protein
MHIHWKDNWHMLLKLPGCDLHPAAYNRHQVIGEPELLSFRDTVVQFERMLGKTVSVQSVPPGDPIPGLLEAVWGFAASFDFYDTPVEMDSLAREFNVS